jgi:hypothetical protein
MNTDFMPEDVKVFVCRIDRPIHQGKEAARQCL